MDLISFVIDTECFNLPLQNIPEGSLLQKMITTSVNADKDKNGYYILNYDKKDFIPIYEYIKNGKIPSYDDLTGFDYFAIDLTHSYELSLVIEEDMRANMYKDKYEELYVNDHHGLIKINENFWNNLQIKKSVDENLLFNNKSLIKSEWSIIKDKLNKLKEFTDIKGVFVAGGSIFSILFGLPINDIDLFLYGVTEDETLDIINKISKLLMKWNILNDGYNQKSLKVIKLMKDVNIVFEEGTNKLNDLYYMNEIKNNKDDLLINDNQYNNVEDKIRNFYNNLIKNTSQKLLGGCFNKEDLSNIKLIFNYIYISTKLKDQDQNLIFSLLNELIAPFTECTRTNNAITFKNKHTEIQIVLRLYQTPSEILHGFDVDSCCLGFDGNDIWMTQRAHFAIKNGYNTVNFNRLSPSYELRLAKYGCRGMAIKINNFDINNVDNNVLSEYFTNNKANYSTHFYINHSHLSKLHNIDKLLYLNYYCEHYNYKAHSIRMINKLNHEKSDYASPSFIDYKKCSNGSGIYDLMGYFYGKYVEYLEFFEVFEGKDEDGPVDFSDLYDGGEEHKNLSKTSKFLKSEVYNATKLLTNSIYNKFWFIKGELQYLTCIINIPDLIYDALKLIQPWDFSAKLQFKVTDPGEQMTNTFHQIILEDNNQWYKGEFYKST